MGNTSRTFLLGAGFSKAVADGPIMKELWCHIEKAYEKERSRTDVSPEDKELRVNWFNNLNKFMTKLEEEAIRRFNQYNFDNVHVEIKENLEYLFTLIDLHLEGPNIRFEKKGSHIEPYPAIPLPFTSKTELEGIRNVLRTYFYLVFVKLEGNILAKKFSKIINPNDDIITFNYDLVLEKALLSSGIWSPLDGYVGLSKFECDGDRKWLEKRNKYSKLKIHKMHGSISWRGRGKRQLESLYKDDDIMIVMDERENQKSHFYGLLDRTPVKIKQGYVGGHEPECMLPSFIKPFERKEFYEIWQSAIKVISETGELVIIGYSFRPEDSNAFLLLSTLPQKCNILLVDPHPEEIKERLENKGFKVEKTFKSLKDYLAGK